MNVARKPGLMRRLYDFADKHLSSETFPLKALIVLFLPIMLEQAFMSLMQMFNTSLVSASGPEFVSAVSMVDISNMIVMQLFIAIATGGSVVVAQYMGRKDRENASIAAGQALFTVTIISIVVSALLFVFRDTFLVLVYGSAEASVLEKASLYLAGSCISFPFYALQQSVSAALRGAGEAKASLVLSVILNISLLVGNIFFFKVMGWGLYGFCLSLIISRIISFLVGVWYISKGSAKLRCTAEMLFKFRPDIQKTIFKIGIPGAMEQLFFHGGKIMTQSVVVMLGTAATAANAIANSATSLYWMPFGGMMLMIVTVVGQCMGAGRVDEAKRYVKNLTITAAIINILVVILTAPFMPLLLGTYNPAKEVLPTIYSLIVLYALTGHFSLSWTFVTPSGLRSAGDAKYTMLIALVTMWIFRVGGSYFLGIVMDFGIFGVWCAMSLEWIVRGTIFYFRYRSNKWIRDII